MGYSAISQRPLLRQPQRIGASNPVKSRFFMQPGSPAESNPYQPPREPEPLASAALPPQSVFGLPDFRCMMVSIACSTLAGQALALVAGYQVFDITGKPVAIGI